MDICFYNYNKNWRKKI